MQIFAVLKHDLNWFQMNGLGNKDSHEKLEAIAALRAELQEKDLLLKVGDCKILFYAPFTVVG